MHALAVVVAGFFLIGLGASREPADTDGANSLAAFTEVTPAIRITGSGCASRLVDDGEPGTLNVGSRVPIGACAQRGERRWLGAGSSDRLARERGWRG